MVAGVYDESDRAAEERWEARLALGARVDAAVPLYGFDTVSPDSPAKGRNSGTSEEPAKPA
jgi:hypothetical protein